MTARASASTVCWRTRPACSSFRRQQTRARRLCDDRPRDRRSLRILIAIWDGLPPRGRGGTGEVASWPSRAARRSSICRPIRRARRGCCGVRSIPTVLTVADDPSVERPLGRADVEALLTGLLMPPPDPQERGFLKRFFGERLRRIRTRIEYPLLLTAAGVRRIRPGDLAEKHCAQQIRDEWQRYREGCGDAHGISAPTDVLEEAYSWADRLATHFAQTYRSGHIFNFVLGGLAVCLGLSAFMAPHLKFEFAAIEMLITLAIILNAICRQRAANGIAAGSTIASSPSGFGRCAASSCSVSPRLIRRGPRPIPCPKRWIDWYASGIWRAMGCPSGASNSERARRGSPRRSRIMKSRRRSPITNAMRCRSSSSTTGWRRSAQCCSSRLCCVRSRPSSASTAVPDS